MALNINDALTKAIEHDAEEAYPNECCGVLIGELGGSGMKVVRQVIRCQNAETGPHQNRYSIDPRDLIRIQIEARQSNLEIIGFYHSHPDHPAVWSRADLLEAHWSGCSYVILSVEKGIAATIRSFVLRGLKDEKQFEEEELRHESAVKGAVRVHLTS